MWLGYYILNGHEPVPCTDVLTWAHWFKTHNRVVEQTKITDKETDEEILVSTVFLGLDHNFAGGKPLIFETMIFGGEHDEFQERYSTWDEAEKGHQEAVTIAKGERLECSSR